MFLKIEFSVDVEDVSDDFSSLAFSKIFLILFSFSKLVSVCFELGSGITS